MRDYISLKQALGRQFDTASRILLRLDQFLCCPASPSTDLTEETFRLWGESMRALSCTTKRWRMNVARNFCLYRRRKNSTCFVPDPTQFPKAAPPVQPYIFSDVEIARLLSHTDHIPNSVRSPLRRAAARLAVVLLYTTGLRRGELLDLRAEDYDCGAKTLLIRASKFHKSRLLPLPDDVAGEIEEFLNRHERIRPAIPTDAPLLWNPYCGGRGYTSTWLRANLHILFKLVGIRKHDGHPPRIHDFRFSFAVNTLIRWYRNGADVGAKLPYLSAYMGHVSILSTFHYLRFIEPLAGLASAAFGEHYGALVENQATDEEET
jgi:integrase